MIEKITGRRVLFVYSDPAGAKAILSLIYLNRDILSNYLIISDREYDFEVNFNLTIQKFSNKSVIQWIETLRPEVVVTATSYPGNLELLFVKEATSCNIEVISFVDHWTNMKDRFLRDEKFILPRSVYVIDEFAKQIAIDEGLPVSVLQVSDNPYYTYLKGWKPLRDKSAVLGHLDLPESTNYLLFAPEPLLQFGLQKKYGFSELDGLNELIKIIIDQQIDRKMRLIIKPHPNHEIDLFNRIELPDFITIANKSDYNELAYYSEGILGFFSNSLIEGFFMQKKIIRILSQITYPLQDPLIRWRGFTNCYTEDCVKKKLIELYDQIS